MFSDIIDIVFNRNIEVLVKKDVGILKSVISLLAVFAAFSIGIGLVGGTDLVFYFQTGILFTLGLALAGFVAISILAIAQFGLSLLLGGKGALKDFYSKSIYLSALIFSVFFSVYLALFIAIKMFMQIDIQLNGLLGIAILILGIIQIILSVYLNFILIKKFMNIGGIKAAIALIVPSIILIYLILISTCFGCGGPYPLNMAPNDIASQKVTGQINQLGLPNIASDVVFQNGDALIAKVIAERSRVLSPDQICLLLSPKAPNQFRSSTTQIIQYLGPLSQKVKLLTLCGRQGEMTQALTDYEYDVEMGLNASTCGFTNDTQRGCIVAIIP